MKRDDDNRILDIRELTFSYPESEAPALRGVSLSVQMGEFVTLCGVSGGGKTTLLRHIKPVLAPYGALKGSIYYFGKPINELSPRAQAAEIGFVRQSPEEQIVTDKVWHELAFGLESLGMGTKEIRLRIAEMASFFGIESWFHREVRQLSGGQKQLLNLAAIMTMQPRLLMLDEPTSQLDPIAATEFLSTVSRLNRELGVTVLLAEHRLEEALPLSDRAIVMENGSIISDGTPNETGERLLSSHNDMFFAMPSAMRIWAGVADAPPCPVTVREGRRWLSSYAKKHTLNACAGETEPRLTAKGGEEKACNSQTPLSQTPPSQTSSIPKRQGEKALELEDVWFRYGKNAPDVLRGLSLSVEKGELFALMGGNGVGKTTALAVIAELEKPYRGSVRAGGRIGCLPQNPQTLFVKNTVEDDLKEIFSGTRLTEAERSVRLSSAVELCRLNELLKRHPYDLSGGEQQRAALAKVLLTEPEILLLDEPTKGVDAGFKLELARMLKKLTSDGVTVLMVSHDVEFCAGCAEKCALMFDGCVVTVAPPAVFFAGNSFYSTAANRIARDLLPNAVTVEDVIISCVGAHGGKREENYESLNNGKANADEANNADDSDNNDKNDNNDIIDTNDNSVPPNNGGVNSRDGEKVKEKAPKPKGGGKVRLPLWRLIIAVAAGLTAVAATAFALNMADVSALLSGGELDNSFTQYLVVYGTLTAALVALAMAVYRSPKSKGENLPDNPQEDHPSADYIRKRRKLPKRTIAAAISILILIPITIFAGMYLFEDRKYYITSLIVLLEAIMPFLLLFEGRKPKARELVLIACLCALGVAGRAAFFMLPNFKPVLALVIIAGVAFGGETGFLVGAMTMLASNVLFGQGPWTPWQMFAMGITGFLAGVLFERSAAERKERGRGLRSRVTLCAFGALCAIIIYGGIMNFASAVMWQDSINLSILLTYYVSGLPVDAIHAVSTAVFLWFLAPPMLEKLERVKKKYGLNA